MTRLRATSLAALVVLAGAFAPQESPAARVNRIVADPKFSAAVAAITRDHDQLIADIIALTEIPAPSFKETARGDAYLRMFTAAGLSDVERDPEGNVLGVRRGTGGGPLVAIAAHLDTVFPEGTDVHVTRQGTRLSAPGIGDNSRSLAVLLAMIRAMDAAGIRTTGDILFVGDVGEEGIGDLRGMKYLFTKGRYKDRITQFIALDGSGPGDDIVTGAVGSRRYLVTFNGPGGHSFGAFGLVSPAFAMASAMQRLSTINVPHVPKTTFNVGRVGGGTSVNSIPKDMWMEVDMRSESPLELEKVETAFLAMVKTSVADENRARSTAEGAIAADVKLIGARPSGQTPKDAPIVRMAAQAVTAAGLQPAFTFSSTDANLPISLGIPAIRLASGGTGDRAHAPDEWIDVERTASVRGIRVVLATLLALAGDELSDAPALCMSIRTERLTKYYGAKLAVSELDLHVEPGEILGFLGPNGAGKSTTVKVLAGLIRPDRGRASICGFDVVTQPLEVKRRLGYVPETPALYESLTANEYLELVSCLHHLDPKTAAARRAELLELFALVENGDQRLNEFSKGMRQKVVLASALIHRPEALILDEPLDGLDANSAMVVKELLKRMAAQGKTIMFSSHILDVVERMCTRIVIINHGQFVTSGTSAEICAHEQAATLEDAFSKLTGVRDVGQVTSEFLASLDRV